MRSNKRGTYWYVSSDNKISNPWFSDGVTGIAHCFIKAYQITGDPIYRKIAEKTLLAHPMHLVHPNFSLAHGMTGLADTYLTAAEVLKDDKWQKRAHFIINTLVHTCRGSEQDSCYWIIEDNKMPTADLMIGNSGILYLLMRYDSQLSGFIL